MPTTPQTNTTACTYKNLSPHTKRRLNISRSTASIQSHGRAHIRRIRVQTAAHGTQPFCNVNKFNESKAALSRSGPQPNPYLTDYEIQMKQAKEGRKNWLHGNFVVTDHKAIVAKRERAVTLVTACGKYDDRNIFHRKVDRTHFITPQGFRT